MGLLQGCCQLASSGAAKGPMAPGSPCQGWLVGGTTAQQRCHPLSLLLNSALFALGQAMLPVSQCSRWPRWLWKLSIARVTPWPSNPAHHTSPQPTPTLHQRLYGDPGHPCFTGGS